VPESAVARHDRMVREEMLQAERVRSTADVPADCWQTLARNFRVPGDPAADPTPDALATLIGPDDAVIDVGAGGGRVAVPLARQCREVVATCAQGAARRVYRPWGVTSGWSGTPEHTSTVFARARARPLRGAARQ